MRKSGIEPFIQLYTARFIPLFIHLTLLILVFVFRDSLIKTCSTTSPPEIWLDAWTGVSLGLVIIEMILSLSGISIFRKYSIFFYVKLSQHHLSMHNSFIEHYTSIPTSNSYGSLNDDIHATLTSPVQQATTTNSLNINNFSTSKMFTNENVSHPYSTLNNETNFTDDNAIVLPPQPKIQKSLCCQLNHRQSETLFAFMLFLLGLSLILFVIVSYWIPSLKISSVVLLICGLLCFIPGVYYLCEKFWCFKKSRMNNDDQDIFDM
ncbi:unnamed protein product [Didymodactylos carnosus]|uniref:Uncharacterized protein n=1 Tax=Didymodactylos carnosus TaxID=1234261 RepID=A0A813QXU9_9BILA|nr:unnamed protein product [Didymodactylos carnosus]CAF0836833.1 unnamed protein product [Didymodactylos carnosus]CAF3557858.1 unnamed protein product [Didymodactylos carnosus]CAF3621659.1 unnamed protein product [Didymodactylos carnosus]